MQQPTAFDVAVVGNGMFGSAATKHLALRGLSVVCIGAPQPVTGQPGQPHTVHASHYDAGRLVRRQSRSALWSDVTTQAIESFRSIEATSGIDFYQPVGCLIASRPGGDGINDDPLDNLGDSGIPYEYFEPGDQIWRQRWPALSFPTSHYVAYEGPPAGYIRPLDLIAAQNVIARQHGAEIVAATVTNATHLGEAHILTTDAGTTFRARHLLVAAGAFTNFNQLLPAQIDISLKTEWIVLGETTPADTDRLADMPTVKYLVDTDEQSPDGFAEGIYMVPPVMYPDGRTYIKLGANTTHDSRPPDLASVQQWFDTAGDELDQAARGVLERHLKALWPSVEFTSVGVRRCIVTYTPDGRPLITTVGDRLHVATGGNGAGAKGSDAWGAHAADLITAS